MKKTTLVAAVAALLAITQSAFAAWPDKPIKLVVPYPPGGSVDMISRQYADHLGKTLGQSVIIENKGGASTNIGTGYAAKATPDGYTIFIGTESMSNNTVLGPVPSFNVVDDIAPVSLLTTIPSLVAANPKFDAENIQELVALAQLKPETYTIGSANLNLQMARIEKATDTQLTHVPYKGGAQASADAVGNQVNMVLASIPVLHPLVSAGKLKPLGITGTKRSPSLPDVPTFKEQGFEEAVFSSWYGVFAPKGTPQDIVEVINSATRKFVADPQIKSRLEGLGYELVASTPVELKAIVHRDIQLAQKFSSFATALAK